MQKKYIIASIAVVVILIIASLGYWQYENYLSQTKIGDYNRCIKLAARFLDQKQAIFDACEKEKAIAEQPDEYNNYVYSPLLWKNLGETTKSNIFLKRAIAIYLLAYDKFPAKYLTSWNLAQLHLQISDLANAEKYFLSAIDNNNLESEPYLATAEFYRYKLQKSADFMRNFYEHAIKSVMIDPYVMLNDYAQYLYDIEEYESALALYEKLAVKQPNDFKVMIDDLKQKINEIKN